MPYTKNLGRGDWKNYPDVTTPIIEAALDNLETQYDEAIADMGLVVAETNVYDGNSPNDWTDLSLVAVVGTNIALVYLKIYNPQGSAQNFAFRADGETEFTDAGNEPSSPSKARILATDFGMVIVHTDALGIVEWMTANVRANTTVDVVAYIPNKN